MKKLMIIALLVFGTVTMSAQKRFEDAAKATVTEMSGVVKLSQEQSDQIYALELKNNIKRGAIREENAGNQPKIQEEMKALNMEAFSSTREILGATEMKTWADYQKEKREKK